MARTITVLAFGLDERVLGTVRQQLDGAGVVLVASAAPAPVELEHSDAVLLDDSGGQSGWRDRLGGVHRARPDLAIVLITADPASLWVTGALRNRRLFQVGPQRAAPGRARSPPAWLPTR